MYDAKFQFTLPLNLQNADGGEVPPIGITVPMFVSRWMGSNEHMILVPPLPLDRKIPLEDKMVLTNPQASLKY
jgi:hypothetical protein